MSGYSILLPPPWQRVNLGRSMADDVRAVVGRAAARAPKEIPPDHLSATRHRMERELMDQLSAAKERGGVDFYFPGHALEGTVGTRPPSAPADTGRADPSLRCRQSRQCG